ncbi:MAG: flavin reductase [Oscillospiraceae bacterium]|nr:flavin reductase [Oscillospiraceae bacterium]MBR6739112.1 flavin reductase [Oscillospiraceae bacterium]
MIQKAQDKLDYTLALLSTVADGKRQGCIINSLHQVTSSFPAKFTVTLNRESETAKAVEASGMFSVTLLGADCPESIVNDFGYKSGRAGDKFASYDVLTDKQGNPYIKDGMVGRLSFKVVDKLEIGNFMLYVAQLVENEILLPPGNVLTLNAFTNRGKATPASATVYRTVEINGYRCTVCGYVYEGESLPEDYRCPICNAPAEKFVKI